MFTGTAGRLLATAPRIVPTLFAAAMLATGCGESPEADGLRIRRVVVATNAPLESFATTLGEGVVEVERPTPVGVDPTLWRPTPETIDAVQRSELVLLQGAGVEPWGGSIPLPAARSRDTTANARSRFPRDRVGTVHSHGGGPAHAHGTNADHAWLDLGIARLQARAVRDALVEIRPEETPRIDERWRRLDRELADLRRRADEVLADAPPMLAAHPIFDFLAHAHDLSIESVEWSSGEPVDETLLATLRSEADTRGASVILVEVEPDERTSGRLAAIGLKAVRFDPLGAGDADGRDFLQRMRDNLDRLAKAFASDDDGHRDGAAGGSRFP